MTTVRCANCGNYNATLAIHVQTGDSAPESTSVCSDCIERLERQALGSVGPLAPHSVLSRLLNRTEEDPSFLCPSCGYDVENLVRTGKLGCCRCYEVFGEEVLNLVQRAIGRTSHRGKYPSLKFDLPEP